MSNYEAFQKQLEAKGAKMLWNVEHASPTAYHTTFKLFFTKEEAKEFFDNYPDGEGWFKKMYPVEDIWNWTEKQELLASLEEAKATGDVRREKNLRYTLAKEFGWFGK